MLLYIEGLWLVFDQTNNRWIICDPDVVHRKTVSVTSQWKIFVKAYPAARRCPMEIQLRSWIWIQSVVDGLKWYCVRQTSNAWLGPLIKLCHSDDSCRPWPISIVAQALKNWLLCHGHRANTYWRFSRMHGSVDWHGSFFHRTHDTRRWIRSI